MITELGKLEKICEKSINPVLLEQARHKIKSFDKSKVKQIKAIIGRFFITDSLNLSNRQKIQLQMKWNDLLAIFMAMIGLICNIISSAIYITFDKMEYALDGVYYISIQVIPNPSAEVQILRFCTSVSTLILLFFIIRHYYIRLEFMIYKQIVDISATLTSTKLIFYLLLEILICAIHSPPYLNNFTVLVDTTTGTPTPVDLDLILSSIVPMRAYLLIRYYSCYSSWADDSAEKVCKESNTKGGMWFAIKAEIKERPYRVVGILMIISIFIFGYSLRNCELAFMQNKTANRFQDWRFVWNGFWCILITILTVGYGDYYPQTHLGRFIAVFSCLWGTFLISLMVVSLTNSADFTLQEEKAYEELKKIQSDRDLNKKAVELLRKSFKLKKYHQSKEAIENEDNYIKKRYLKDVEDFKTTLEEFRTMRKYVIAKEQEVSAENILYKLNDNISEEMEYLIFNSNEYVNSLQYYIQCSKEVQEEINKYLTKLEKMTQGLHNCLQ